MSDYYSHKDPRKVDPHGRMDYETSAGTGWIWALVLLVGFVGLIIYGASTSDPSAARTDAIAPTAPAAPADPVATPQPTD